MIQTVVSNASAPEYGQATISFPIREEDYPNVVNMLQSMGLGDPVERDCRVDEVCGDWPILKRLEKVAINLDEMDYLAKRLDSFDAQEKAKFQAAAVKYGLFDMRHLIDLTFCCEETTVITDFSDLEKVGRRHFLDVNGGSASSEELENVDGYETALLLIGDGDGTITPYGVIYDNGMQLRPVYDGRNFPLYQDGDSVFLLGLTHKSDPDMNPPTTWLFLPTCRERLERTLRRGGYESEDDIHIRLSQSTAPNEIDSRLDVEHESLNNLNKLASAIVLLDVDQGAKLEAVVQMANPRSATEMTTLAQNLDLFNFVPGIHSPREYGEFMIRESGHFDLDEDLVHFIDYEAYGQKQINAEGGVFKNRGYVAFRGESRGDNIIKEVMKQASAEPQEHLQTGLRLHFKGR
ncbi:antirestriction protein ArdA [Dysosmobacter sp. Marseille-Q4140]|nr:antirestriction protein ArdA [Dysosmobacter sp. Marseille-Q4140]